MLFEHKKHKVYSGNICKIVLNRDEDTRIVQGDGVTTLARGFVSREKSLFYLSKPS